VARDYRPVDRDQRFLLPPDMREWLPPGHLVWMVLDTVAVLDLGRLHAARRTGGVGRRGYHPGMLLGLLIYGYCTGVRSSRQIERLCEVDVAFRVLCAQDTPDHTTIARFRAEHAEAVAGLFEQVLTLCGRAGMGRVGLVAVDGTKVAANASLQASRDGAWLQAEVARMLGEADAIDAAEDAEHGAARGDEPPAGLADPASRRARIRAAWEQLRADYPDPPPGPGQAPTADPEAPTADPEAGTADPAAEADPAGGDPAARSAEVVPYRVARAERALARARDHHAAELARAVEQQAATLARRAAAHAVGQWHSAPRAKPPAAYAGVVRAAAKVAEAEQRLDTVRAGFATRRARRAAKAAAKATADRAAARRNITDPDSRIMPVRQGWVQGYNAQIVVSEDGLIVAADVVNTPADTPQLSPMMGQAVTGAAHLDRGRGHRQPVGLLLADNGYFSHHNLNEPGPQRLIATGKSYRVHAAEVATGDPPPDTDKVARNAHLLRTPDGKNLYKRRGAIVEPVFGTIKHTRGMRRFSRRGLTAARAEWRLAAIAHNLLRLHTTTALTAAGP
jgi:transposase